jgi:hypothetical protein
MYDEKDYGALIGATVTAIYMSEEDITFETDRGLVGYRVEGDCCSHSYFFDFRGVRNLLENGPVIAFEAVALSPGDPGYHPSTYDIGDTDPDELAVYGYRITTDHPKFGPVTSVFSFRNSSNGYYGGWMERVTHPAIGGHLITDDVIDLERVETVDPTN